MVGSQSCLIPFVHPFQFNGNTGSVLASGERSDLPYYLSAADGSACEIAGVSARWRYASCRAAFSRALLFSMFAVATSILPHMFSTRSRRVSNARLFVGAAASVRLSRAPHFSGGDEHPAALGQACARELFRKPHLSSKAKSPESNAQMQYLAAGSSVWFLSCNTSLQYPRDSVVGILKRDSFTAICRGQC